MPWIKDYFAVCSKCHNQEWMDGRNVREAERYARKNGWSVKPLVCPNCRGNLTMRAPDEMVRHGVGRVVSVSEAPDLIIEDDNSSRR